MGRCLKSGCLHLFVARWEVVWEHEIVLHVVLFWYSEIWFIALRTASAQQLQFAEIGLSLTMAISDTKMAIEAISDDINILDDAVAILAGNIAMLADVDASDTCLLYTSDAADE